MIKKNIIKVYIAASINGLVGIPMVIVWITESPIIAYANVRAELKAMNIIWNIPVAKIAPIKSNIYA